VLTTDYADEQAGGDLILNPPPPPQLEYHFDEGTGTVLVDHSGNGYNGTLADGLGSGYLPTWVTGGLNFASPSCVGVPTAAIVGARTILWFALPTYSDQADMGSVLTFYGSEGTNAAGYMPGEWRPAMMINDIYGSSSFNSGQPITSGIHSVALRDDGTAFFNGEPVPWYGPPATGEPAPPWAPNVTHARLGMYPFGAYCFYQGRLYWLQVWSESLTNAQILYAHEAGAAVLTARGLVVAGGTALAHTLLIFAGDSITREFLATAAEQGYPQATLGLMSGTYNYVNIGVGGYGSSQMNAALASYLPPLLATHTGTSVLIYMIGTNEDWSGTLANNAAEYTAAKALGVTYVVGVQGLPRFSADGPRAAYNSALAAGIGTYADAVALWASDPNMGQAGQYSNATYYADGLHPTSVGHALGAGYLQTALASLGIT
jgi:lysophospholipase L1-like esterase